MNENGERSDGEGGEGELSCATHYSAARTSKYGVGKLSDVKLRKHRKKNDPRPPPTVPSRTELKLVFEHRLFKIRCTKCEIQKVNSK